MLIAEFLVQKKDEKAKDHLQEVAELEEEVVAAWDRYTTNIHARAALANAPASPATRRPPPAADSNTVKLLTELKPDTPHMMLMQESYAFGAENTRLTITPLTCSWLAIKFNRPTC